MPPSASYAAFRQLYSLPLVMPPSDGYQLLCLPVRFLLSVITDLHRAALCFFGSILSGTVLPDLLRL